MPYIRFNFTSALDVLSHSYGTLTWHMVQMYRKIGFKIIFNMYIERSSCSISLTWCFLIFEQCQWQYTEIAKLIKKLIIPLTILRCEDAEGRVFRSFYHVKRGPQWVQLYCPPLHSIYHEYEEGNKGRIPVCFACEIFYTQWSDSGQHQSRGKGTFRNDLKIS